jgi:hypothetical protein
MNPFQARRAKHLYACKIKETANGRRCGARSETWKTLKVITQRSVETNGKIDERKTIARDRENQTQEIAEEKTALEKDLKLICSSILSSFSGARDKETARG